MGRAARWIIVFGVVAAVALGLAAALVEPVPVPLQVCDLSGMVLISEGLLPDGLSGQSKRVPAFYLDRFEVTESAWRLYRRQLTGVSRSTDLWSVQDRRGPAFPMRYVSLAEARGFARFVGKRLPTNQEWERACRGRGGPFPWGRFYRDDAANVLEIWEGGTASVLRVGTFESGCNEAGAYDLVGNVWEWTSGTQDDLLHLDLNSAGELDFLSLTRWTGEDYAVIRGGAFSSRLRGRSAFEDVENAAQKSRDIGFRCAISLEELREQQEIVPLIQRLGYRDPWNHWWHGRPAAKKLVEWGATALPYLEKTLNKVSDESLRQRLETIMADIRNQT